MTNGKALAARLAMMLAAFVQIMTFTGLLMAQANPRGVTPPRRNTPEFPERDFERESSRKVRRVDVAAPDRHLILLQIKKDFQQIQVLNEELGQQAISNDTLDYKYISDKASKMKSLAGRLDSNLILGKSESKEMHTDLDVNDETLRSSLVTLHDLVIRFVENPIFRESGVYDIHETRKAKQDVDSIVSLSEQIKRIARKLRR